MTTIEHSEKTIDSADGTTLYTQSWHPSSNPKAYLVMCHGYLEHCGRYREVGEYMVSFGIATTVFDFRGHGKSAGTRAFVADFSNYHDDIKAVVEAVVKPNDDVAIPLFLLGHSNGALAVFDFMLVDPSFFKTPVKGLIISSPFLAPANELSYFKVLISKLLGYLFPTLALPANEVTAEILMHDEGKRQEHKNDALVQSKFTLGWAVQGMRAQKRVKEDLKECVIPLLFLYAEDDKVACPSTNQRFANEISQPDKTVVERKGEYHEILNETKRTETYALIKEWVLQRV